MLIAKTILGKEVNGWIVRWHCNQTVQPLPQWPRIRVTGGQELSIAVQPGEFGIALDTRDIQLAAIIECDNGRYYIIAFPKLQME